MITAPELRFYKEGDEVAILDLFKSVFKKDMSKIFWKWRFGKNPCDAPQIILAWDGDVLAGHYAVCPTDITIDGQRVKAALSMTTMTHPNYQGMGLFPSMAGALYERLDEQGYAMVYGFPNNNSHNAFVKKLKWQDVAEIPMLSLNVDHFRPRRNLGEDCSVEPVTWQDLQAYEVDGLLANANAKNGAGLWRSLTGYQWRLRDCPDVDYQPWVCTKDGMVTGLAFSKTYLDQETDIVDLVALNDDAQYALLRDIVSAAKVKSVGRINTWCNLHSAERLMWGDCGFTPEAPITFLGCRGFSSLTSLKSVAPQSWRYSMMDSDVF